MEEWQAAKRQSYRIRARKTVRGKRRAERAWAGLVLAALSTDQRQEESHGR